MKHRPGLSVSYLSVTGLSLKSLAGFGLAIATSAASAGAPTTRYWAAPLIGFWDDAANWSLSDGGPVGGGIPQNGDVVRFTIRTTCLFDGQLGLPIQSTMLLAGTGSGQSRTLLNQFAGLLRCETIRVGNGTLGNDLKVSGGSLNTSTMYVGDLGGEGLLEVSGTGSVGPISSFNILYVGFAEGDGLVDIRGGSVDFDEVYLSIDSVTGTPGGPADLMMSGGTLTIDEFYVGYGGRGFAQFFGGTATASTCTVGLVGESGALRPQLNVGTGGDFEVVGTLTIGDFEETVGEEPGDGRVLVTGGSLNAGRIDLARDAGTDGELIVDGGFADASNMDIGLGGLGTATLDSGQLRITNIAAVGAAPVGNGSTGVLEIGGGSFIAGSLLIGEATNAAGFVTIGGGVTDASVIRVGHAPGSQGSVDMTAGTVTADAITIGNQGRGTWVLEDGTIDTTLLEISNNPGVLGSVFSQNGGTVFADSVIVRPDSDTGVTDSEYSMQGGVLAGQSVTIEAGARAFWVQQADARVTEVVNNGRFTFGGGEAKLSGPMLGPPFNTRLIGDFINNGDLDASTRSVGTLFAMDLFNNGTIEQFNDEFWVSGRIVNDGTIEIADTFYDGFGQIALRTSSPLGIVNNAGFTMRFVRIAAPEGEIVNNGTMTGFARFLSPFTNNGALLPDPARIDENLLEIDGDFTSGPASSARFVITEAGHNRIAATGDVALDGAINIAFAQGFPLPAGGTEYDLVTTSGGTITGTFATEAILGYPCEIVYEPTRVFARSLRCNAGDFAPPFGILDLADISAFIAAFTGGNPLADLNGDSFLDLADLGLFIGSFTGGCP